MTEYIGEIVYDERWNVLTPQEDVARIMAILGCKNDACAVMESPDGWFQCEGDIYCGQCAFMLEFECGASPKFIPTAYQRAEWAKWEAQDIGVN